MAHIERIIQEIEATSPPPTALTWAAALVGSVVVGLSGVVPIVLIPIDNPFSATLTRRSDTNLKLLLSFAVGGLLGDVFLHLLPEAYGALKASSSESRSSHQSLGIWILGEIRLDKILGSLRKETIYRKIS